jgi:hypothetical protein
MAIANAKAALEEAFTPQLQSMLSAKLQEMDEDEDSDLMEDETLYEVEELVKKIKNLGDFGFTGDKIEFKGLLVTSSTQEDENETPYYFVYGEDGEDEIFSSTNPKKVAEFVFNADEASLNEDMDLDELLNELEEEDEMESEEGEPLDLEDMTDEDLKKMIEDVISDMMESGELEMDGIESEEENEEENEEEMEDEINLDELLAEIEGMDEDMDEDMMYEEEEDLDEAFGDMFKSSASKFIKDNQSEVEKIKAMSDKSAALDAAAPLINKFRSEQLKKGQTPNAVRADVSDLRQKLGLSGLGGASKGAVSIAEKLQKELDEALNTIKSLRGDLNEVNLLNAKLLFTNKIFKAKNLTESQKVNVLSSFDKATSVKEVKLVFETLNEGLKTKNNRINENFGSASKVTGTKTNKQPIVESDDMVLRFQKLAGII